MLCVAVPVVIVVAAVVRSSQSLLLQHVKKERDKRGGEGAEVGIEKRDERERRRMDEPRGARVNLLISR